MQHRIHQDQIQMDLQFLIDTMIPTKNWIHWEQFHLWTEVLANSWNQLVIIAYKLVILGYNKYNL